MRRRVRRQVWVDVDMSGVDEPLELADEIAACRARRGVATGWEEEPPTVVIPEARLRVLVGRSRP